MKRLFYLFVWVSPFTLLSQTHDPVDSAYETLIKRFHKYVDQGELPGTVIFLEKEGVLKKDVYGYQDVETRVSLSERSVFRLASMTKPLVATAIMQLIEQGKLALNDPVKKYIPQIAHMNIYDGTVSGRKPQHTMTIQHLLSHTSGSTGGFDFSDAGKAAQRVYTQHKADNLTQWVEVICSTQLAFEPGEGWAYGLSNDLLAYIIEKVSGKTIDKYLDTHIFQPLEMEHTGFQTYELDLLISIHATDQEGGLKVIETAQESRYANGKTMARGNTGLVGTAGDYLHFCQMILNQGMYKGKRILTPGSLALMMENVVPEKYFPMKVAANEMLGQGYGLGFGVVMKNSPFGTKGDVYWPGSLYTYFFVSPKNNACGIFMTQLFDMNKMGLIWEFHDLATKALGKAH